MVTSFAGEAAILRAAIDHLRRAGRAAPMTPVTTLYAIPYYVVQEAGEGGAWVGRAGVRLPSPDLARIPIFGSNTRAFDASLLPPGAIVLEPTMRLDEVAGEARALELRQVLLAHVLLEGTEHPCAPIWIDAERCRVLSGPSRPAAAQQADTRGLGFWLAALALGGGVPALLLPFPWSALAAAPALAAASLRARRRFGEDPAA
jgi:hypothetical protein